jgi:hypothetical protein
MSRAVHFLIYDGGMKVRMRTVLAALACVALLAGGTTADAALYAVSRNDRNIYEIDATTGAVISSVPMAPVGDAVVSWANGLALDPTTGKFWALVTFGPVPGRKRQLIIVDPVTGATTNVGNTGDAFAGIAFDCDGTLYGVTGDGATFPSSLFKLSKVDASPTFVRTLGNGNDGEAIAFNPLDGLIYHASGRGTANVTRILETIDPTTLEITNVPLSGHDHEEITALTMSPTGDLLAVDIGNYLFPISTNGVTSPPAGDEMPFQAKGLAFDSRLCGPRTCASSPADCVPAGKVTLAIDEKKPGKEKFKAVLKNLTAPLGQSDFGDPVAGSTGYAVCTYDEGGALVASMIVDRPGETCGTKPCWKGVSSKGYAYDDKFLSADGIQKIVGKGGAAGKGSVQASGKNDAAKGFTALPTGIAAALSGNTSATVQIVTSDAACFTGTATSVQKADGLQFKAKAP